MATIKPTPKICKVSFNDKIFNCFLKYSMVPNVSTVISNLYHTSRPSFSPINFPKMAVKPAKKTAVCNCNNAFFIGGKDNCKGA